MVADLELRKRAAAEHALEYVRDGTVLGLGSGSTAEIFLAGLAERVRQGLGVVAVPTSERTAALARAAGIPLSSLDQEPRLAVTVDGADEIDPATLALIKGRGGALLREKLVAAASDQEIIVADDSKLVSRLGERRPVPVEVVRFGWQQTARRLERLGCSVNLRIGDDTPTPFVSDEGHLLLDCAFGPIPDPAKLASEIKSIVGVVEHGLFIGLTHRVVIGCADWVQVLEAPR